jgi:putative two-component system response regulator
MSLPSDSLARTATVLVVDDRTANLGLLERLLVPDGYTILTALDAPEALAIVAHEHPDVVLIDRDLVAGGGLALCRDLKTDPGTRLIPVVLFAESADPAGRVEALDAGADDLLLKPLEPLALKARVRSLMRLKRFTDDLDSAEAVMQSLALMIEARDPYTRNHCQRLAGYAEVLGRELNLPEDDLVALRRGGYFHDIGKIAIPDAILLKPDRLTTDEYDRMKSHPVIGDQLCGALRTLQRAQPIVRHHHERLDGSGYPDGLRGDAVPLLAQIIGIVDVYDAITTERPYKPAKSSEAACGELLAEARRGWRDPALVDAFVAAARSGRLDPPPAELQA